MLPRLKKKIFIALIGLGISANGQSDCDLSFQHGFVPIKELAVVLKAQASSVSIKILLKSGQWESCSGAVVSDQGHIMTAAHCLDDCSDNEKSKPNSNSYSAYGAYGASGSYGALGSEKERPTKCIAKIDGVQTTVAVKLTSKCSFLEHQAAAGMKPKQKCSESNDTSVILPEKKIGEKPCLLISKSFREGEKVYTIGYPSATSRGKLDSDGVSQYASFGEIIPHSDECIMYIVVVPHIFNQTFYR